MASKALTIRNAVITDLANITTGNGYSVTLNTVQIHTGPERSENLTTHPSVQVVFDNDERDTGALHRIDSTLTLAVFVTSLSTISVALWPSTKMHTGRC